MANIGRLEIVPLREIWKHEERDFSAWLENNLDVLSEAIDMRLSDPQREHEAGRYEVDLLAVDENGARVIVENQLEPTNHDHLGKLITYLTNLEAKTAVWITRHPRPEHIRAIQWLNEVTPVDTAFFLVRIAAYRISESVPAPLLTLIVGPSTESKNMGKDKERWAERHALRLKFWEQLLSRARKKGVLLHAQRSPSTDYWISAGAGVKSGVSFNYTIRMLEGATTELYIDTGDKKTNERIFDALHAHRAEIEDSFGSPLAWERLDDKRACRIRWDMKEGGLKDEGTWQTTQDAMIDSMDKLAISLKPYLGKV